MATTWIFNVLMLFGNEISEGWKLGHWFESLAWLVCMVFLYVKARSPDDLWLTG